MTPPPRLSSRTYLVWFVATAVIGFALAWIYVAALPMAFLDDEFARWTAKRHLLEACDLGRVLIVGDSRAAVDIMPAGLRLPVTNLALAGSSSIEAYVTVKRALDCPNPPDIVILSLSPSHFPAPDTFWGKSARYRFLTEADLEEVYRNSARLGDYGIFDLEKVDELPPPVRVWMYGHDFPSVYFNSLFQSGVFGRLRRNEQTEADVRQARGQYFFAGMKDGTSEIAPEGEMRTFVPLRILDFYFGRVLALLNDRNIRVYFLPMPINEATRRVVNPLVPSEFAQYLESYAMRYRNFHLLGDVMPAWRDQFFADPKSHLNRSGAELLTQALDGCLDDLIAAQDPAPDACRSLGLGAAPMAEQSGALPEANPTGTEPSRGLR